MTKVHKTIPRMVMWLTDNVVRAAPIESETSEYQLQHGWRRVSTRVGGEYQQEWAASSVTEDCA